MRLWLLQIVTRLAGASPGGLQRHWAMALIGAGALAAASEVSKAADDGEREFFESRVRPVLMGTCIRCHGGDKTNNGLRVDSRESLLKGGKSGPAIVPGKPKQSLLISAIKREHAKIKMPPKETLAEYIVTDLTLWVRLGAPWPEGKGTPLVTGAGGALKTDHWAFQKRPAKISPPQTSKLDPKLAGWAKTDIDKFLLVEMAKKNLTPSAPADRRTLLRRASYDLTGLAPTPEQMAAFEADDSPKAFEKAVDRLLASPAYGEKWGRWWLDLARYSDTAGDSSDYPIPEAYLYRNYVIDSINADKPFDRFVQEQIAGDILAARDPSRARELIVATGYVALSKRYGVSKFASMNLTIDDSIDTISRGVMGLTVSCARCHDHKFDPIGIDDYYALYGIFQSTKYPFAGCETDRRPSDFVPLPNDGSMSEEERLAKIKQLEAKLALLQKTDGAAARLGRVKDLIGAAEEAIRQGQSKGEATEFLQGRLEKLQAERLSLEEEAEQASNPLKQQLAELRMNEPGRLRAYAVQEGKGTDATIYLNGDSRTKGGRVPRGFLNVIEGGRRAAVTGNGSGRLELAQWVTGAEHPLTARVLANRLWQAYFGRGIVSTPSNFGALGARPSHPQLLDWLANELVAGGWKLKRMHRMLMLTAAYQQASVEDPVREAIDPENIHQWRHTRRRVEAEELRDSAMLAAGTLRPGPSGAHPFPEESSWKFSQHSPFKAVYQTDRRTVYMMTQRIQKHPFLGLFDGPDTNETTAERRVTTVPLQALYLMNSPFMTEQTLALAQRLISDRKDAPGRIARLYELAYQRKPLKAEQEEAREFLAQYEQTARKLEPDAAKRELAAWRGLAWVILSSNEFATID